LICTRSQKRPCPHDRATRERLPGEHRQHHRRRPRQSVCCPFQEPCRPGCLHLAGRSAALAARGLALHQPFLFLHRSFSGPGLVTASSSASAVLTLHCSLSFSSSPPIPASARHSSHLRTRALLPLLLLSRLPSSLRGHSVSTADPLRSRCWSLVRDSFLS